MLDIRSSLSSSTDRVEVHTNSCWLRRVCSSTVSEVSRIRWRICAADQRYNGSQDTTRCPAIVASALKLAGPSAHPRMREFTSCEDSANIRQYSSNERPHGTT